MVAAPPGARTAGRVMGCRHQRGSAAAASAGTAVWCFGRRQMAVDLLLVGHVLRFLFRSFLVGSLAFFVIFDGGPPAAAAHDVACTAAIE